MGAIWGYRDNMRLWGQYGAMGTLGYGAIWGNGDNMGLWGLWGYGDFGIWGNMGL